MRNTLFALLICISCKSPTDDTISAEDLGLGDYGTLSEPAESHMDFSEEENDISELDKRFLDAGLVNIQTVIPEAIVDLKYSSTDNFFGKDVYGDLQNAYLQPEVVKMLAKAYQYLQETNSDLTLLIYDAVRPLSVQQVLWDNLDKPDSLKPLYVADPKKGSLHNFGVAVDLTLANKETGAPLDMGTTYDYFGYMAYPDRENQMLREGKITQHHIDNRKLLRRVMLQSGFKGIGSEWWHFNAYTRREAGEIFQQVK